MRQTLDFYDVQQYLNIKVQLFNSIFTQQLMLALQITLSCAFLPGKRTSSRSSTRNGSPVSGPDCPAPKKGEKQAAKCADCDPGFHRSKKKEYTCVPKCYCDGGVAASEDQGCTGGQHCVKCNRELLPPKAKKCGEVRTCTCKDGTHLTGFACQKHGAVGCGSCNVGFHPEVQKDGSNSCNSNKCTCGKGGTAAEGTECPIHQLAYCSKCDAGYLPKPDRSMCVEVVCQCRLGTPAKGTDCPSPNTRKCASCPPAGYTLLDGTCKANRCICEVNGERAGEEEVGPGCPKASQMACKTCFSVQGYKVRAGSNPKTCQPVCRCPGGFGEDLTGKPGCTRPGPKCANCKKGYWMNGNQVCQPNQCMCPDLTPAMGPA